MNILLVGSGGREHALAWKIAQSPLLEHLYTIPGNTGTAQHGTNIPGDPLDSSFVINTATEKKIDLVIIGPEAPLSEGLADGLERKGFLVFGPSQAGAQMESSKAFSKEFMTRHKIPTSAFQVFNNLEDAANHLEEIDYPFVIKASGLAAGKGVFLPDTIEEGKLILKEIMTDKIFGSAGDTVLVEERISGPEISVLAFTDGETLVLMPPAQDYKRLSDNDQGPNTGGMGVIAPSPTAIPEIMEEAKQKIMQPTIDGLRAEGIDYKGVLYGGLMLTKDGLKTLEFNCRFGDPETQVILPLLESDLLEIAKACAARSLSKITSGIKWKDGSAACVVLASEGYPGSYPKGRPISGLNNLDGSTIAFHAGTAKKDDQIVTNGGRVLGITSIAESLPQAVDVTYQELKKINFEGMQFRTDIGKQVSAYSAAGVSIDTGNQAVQKIKSIVNSTHGPEVLSGIGSFGGLFDASILKEMDKPILVGSTDGVGTKVMLAEKYGLLENAGKDIVNHCINDILVQGAKPLFFLDYFATARLDINKLAEVVEGISKACKQAGCALLGGETAEMPGVYCPEQFDLAGTIVGVVDHEKLLPKNDIKAGDLIVAFGSTGPHTNGFSLIRKVFENISLDKVYPELDIPLGEALLKPHRSYLGLLWPLINMDNSPIKGLAHLTGGGFFDNIPRILPEGCGAEIHFGSWPVLPIFEVIQQTGKIEKNEMYHVFNMGIGMIAVIHPENLDTVLDSIPEKCWVIGKVVPGGEVKLV